MATELVAGRYRLLRELGRGGMATVYLALDEKHRREVALKLLRPELAREIGAERFLREIEITAALNHPHILPLLDSGADAGALWYVMPYVPGGSLRPLLQAVGLPLEAVTRIVREIASALDHAHARGIVHRDIKPENVLFNDGLAVVADFGIARMAGATARRMTTTGLSLGTPGYMSPEQALGSAQIDARTDVYSLGAVAFEMLLGETPSSWPGAEDVELGRFAELPPAQRARLDALPGRVEQVLVRALALRPQHRFASAGELSVAVAAAADHTPALGDEAVRRLLRRAADLQAAAPQPPGPGELTMGAVEQVAAQVGIPPGHVRQAAWELAGARAATAAASSASGPASSSAVLPSLAPSSPAPPAVEPPVSLVQNWRRLRERWDRLGAIEQLPGEVPASAYPQLVTEIERRLRIVGHASVMGGTLTWSPAASEAGRKVVIQVSSAAGRTSIRIQEDLALHGVEWLTLPAAALSGGALGSALPLILGMDASGGPVLAIFGALGAVFAAVRGTIAVEAGARAPGLAELMAALVELARRAAGEAAAAQDTHPVVRG